MRVQPRRQRDRPDVVVTVIPTLHPGKLRLGLLDGTWIGHFRRAVAGVVERAAIGTDMRTPLVPLAGLAVDRLAQIDRLSPMIALTECNVEIAHAAVFRIGRVEHHKGLVWRDGRIVRRGSKIPNRNLRGRLVCALHERRTVNVEYATSVRMNEIQTAVCSD